MANGKRRLRGTQAARPPSGALTPLTPCPSPARGEGRVACLSIVIDFGFEILSSVRGSLTLPSPLAGEGQGVREIGRASCRERVEISAVAVSATKRST